MRQTFAYNTWLDPEEKAYSSPSGKPSGSHRKFKAIATFPGSVGKLVGGTAGVADSFFTIPAIARVGRHKVSGYLTVGRRVASDAEDTLLFVVGARARAGKRFPGNSYSHPDEEYSGNPDAVHIDIMQGRGAHHNPRTSRAAQRFISSKIRKLAHEGYEDSPQRAAIAYSMARRRGFKVGKNPRRGPFAVIDHGEVVPSLGLRFTVQRLSEGPHHPTLQGQGVVADGMTYRVARAMADSLNRHHLRGNPRSALFRRRRNPVLAVMGANPPHAAGTPIEASWARIEYQRPDDPEGKKVARVHDFNDGFVATPQADGSILLTHPRGKHLWTRR